MSSADHRDIAMGLLGVVVLAATLGYVFLGVGGGQGGVQAEIVTTDGDETHFAWVEYCDDLYGHEVAVQWAVDGADSNETYVVNTSLDGEVRDTTTLRLSPDSSKTETVTMFRPPDDSWGQPERTATVKVTVSNGAETLSVASDKVTLSAVNQDRECRDPPGE